MGDINWHPGSPDAAFEQARILGKPLFLYWGAGWCPPCNRIKASVFTHPEFLALAPQFVALHIDGDSPGAQQLAERFKVRSYPTLVVYRPDGTEITRLPCELGPKRFIHTLERALHANYTATESLSAALSGERPLADNEWCLLSYYSWDTDERQLLKSLDFAATVASMTKTCTLPDAALRLRWHSLHAAASAGLGGIDRGGAIDEIVATLADNEAVCEQMDIVVNYAVDLVRFLTEPGSEPRLRLTRAWADALAILEEDDTLNLGDRLQALRTRVRMARLGAPIPGLEQVARASVARAVAAAGEPALRHTVLNTAAGVLSDAGLLDEAEQLLLAELERSHSQYYFMHNLAAIAKKRGDAARAVQWYERAWDLATGPATRLQWGTTYLQGLIDFVPADAPRIDKLAGQMLDELHDRDDAFYQRNRTQMQRIASSMAKWDGASVRAAALREVARPA